MRYTCQNIMVRVVSTEGPPGSPKMPPVTVFRHFAKFLYFCMELPDDDTNELSKDGFDGISLNVIFQGWKGQISPFSHIYLYH